MPTLWAQFWSFHSYRFYCLTCRNLKKKKKGRKKRYKGKERRNKTRKKEREEKCVKRKNYKIIKNYLKKKKPPAGFKLAKPVLMVFLAATA